MKKIVFLGLIWVIAACSPKENDRKESVIQIERFDQKLMAVQTKEELQNLLLREPIVNDLLFGTSPKDTAFISDLFHMIQHKDARKLFDQDEKTFGNLNKIGSDLSIAFAEIKKLYPDYKPPRIVAAFSGLRNDLMVTDSVIVISLEAFIGPKAVYRPDYPEYMLSRFSPEYIVPNVIRLVSNKFNNSSADDISFTNEMIFYGKSLEFSRAVLPHIPDSLIIGYSNREMQNSYEHQDVIWAHVIDKQLLNSENPAVNAKYFEERPYVGEIGPDCPGRIGQWIGWRVVELYRMKNPAVSIPELMKNADAQSILRGSNYRGQKDE